MIFLSHSLAKYYSSIAYQWGDIDNLDEYIEYLDEHFGDWILDERGQWRISDYGLDPLMKKVSELRKIHQPEKKLVKIDEIFAVVHPRSDIAGLFVEGGSRSLSQLSSVDEFEPKPAHRY